MNGDELIAILQALPAEVRAMPVAFHVYGHTYVPEMQKNSHGPFMVASGRPNTAELCMIMGPMLTYKLPDCVVHHRGTL